MPTGTYTLICESWDQFTNPIVTGAPAPSISTQTFYVDALTTPTISPTTATLQVGATQQFTCGGFTSYMPVSAITYSAYSSTGGSGTAPNGSINPTTGLYTAPNATGLTDDITCSVTYGGPNYTLDGGSGINYTTTLTSNPTTATVSGPTVTLTPSSPMSIQYTPVGASTHQR